jgi:hypothetical protein
MKIALRLNNLYVCAELDGTVNANRLQIGPWETWEVLPSDTLGQIALKSAHGGYLRAEGGGGGEVTTFGRDTSAWQSWLLQQQAGYSSLAARDRGFLGTTLGFRVDAASSLPVAFELIVVEADAPPPLPGLYRQGKEIRTTDGKRYMVRGSTELLLGHKYDTEGEASIDAILDQRRELGFTNYRVLWQKDIRNQNQPWSMPLHKIAPFLKKCSDRGRAYVQGCILADCQVVNPSTQAQQRRVNDVRNVTAGISNNIDQLGNEFDKNGFDWRNFSKATDRLSINASGTNGFDPSQVWDVFVFSGERSPAQKAIREYGPIEVMYANGRPAVCDEGMVPGEDSSDPREYERAGAQGRSGSGARFHSRAGSNRDPGPNLSRLFTPLEYACAEAFLKGLGGDES